jgi:hypothetical protein
MSMKTGVEVQQKHIPRKSSPLAAATDFVSSDRKVTHFLEGIPEDMLQAAWLSEQTRSGRMCLGIVHPGLSMVLYLIVWLFTSRSYDSHGWLQTRSSAL